MRIVEHIEAWGHINITAENKATFEITKDKSITRRGDCIIGIRASKGVSELNEGFKRLARNGDARITVILSVDDIEEVTVGRGSPLLSFKHPTDLVARKSSYICERTLMIAANKAAADSSRVLVQRLKNPNQKINISLIIDV